jgi:signal peptidase
VRLRSVVTRVLVAAVGLVLIGTAVLLACGALPYRIYIIHTGSMSPTIPTTSAVIVRKGEYHLGQPVSFYQHGEVITHRLVARNLDGTFTTKGDANATVDPWTIPANQVIGGVVAAPYRLGYWLEFFKNPAGLAAFLAVVLCLSLIGSITKDLAADADPGPSGAVDGTAKPARRTASHRAGRHRPATTPLLAGERRQLVTVPRVDSHRGRPGR